ncbi:alpha-ketoglutarate-dependent dioxygenase AlkB family protein [Noviherbaspirillum saxi]|uniref:Alpha-ketoglutarate-dependent dioxygenase AlkB n=1 Tax=Noviherbaspirillum saxi TaxID=2320863 RepID=A0A3A3FUU4_9BURK|nr:alpha-ketoglutarate-dependent dioxygenase AlkB [Noviherbaspirillum saxi]RJF99340.1 alpha-ketoglutarate-dependent dioxygenase AlkB [Noviherbaspirillum saxi]
MNDSFSLFDDAPALEPIPMVDADVRFMHGFYRTPQSQALMQALLAETPWRQESIVLWEKEYLQPRLSAWYGDAGSVYAYSGKRFHPLPWTDTLLAIKHDVEAATSQRFNSVLLNLYRDENDGVGWHSDAEQELGRLPVIASLSLGETRTFRLRHRTRKDITPVSIELTDGSLLLMAGETQRKWQHTITKERMPREARINLTFRTILVPA